MLPEFVRFVGATALRAEDSRITGPLGQLDITNCRCVADVSNEPRVAYVPAIADGDQISERLFELREHDELLRSMVSARLRVLS